MQIDLPYNRAQAVEYARKWAFSRNPAYYDFHGLGGDCTNFVSQCIYAGAGVMNDTPTFGWYYRSPDDRTPSWTGVPYLYQFLTTNDSVGPYASEVDASEMQPGDVIQLGDEDGKFYHTMLVVATRRIPSPRTIYIATHTNDAYMRRLSSYAYAQARFLHIDGVRASETE